MRDLKIQNELLSGHPVFLGLAAEFSLGGLFLWFRGGMVDAIADGQRVSMAPCVNPCRVRLPAGTTSFVTTEPLAAAVRQRRVMTCASSLPGQS